MDNDVDFLKEINKVITMYRYCNGFNNNIYSNINMQIIYLSHVEVVSNMARFNWEMVDYDNKIDYDSNIV